MESLRCIVYVSTATRPMPEDALEELLLEARQRNRETGATGVLLYADGNFMQYFEGTDDAVARTYERIRASRQHRDLIELMDEPIARREYPDWQMGFTQPTASQLLALSNASWQRSADRQAASGSASGAGSRGLELLRLFVETNR